MVIVGDISLLAALVAIIVLLCVYWVVKFIVSIVTGA